MAPAGADGSNGLALHVDRFDGRLDKARPPQGCADGLRAVPQFQPSGARFEQKRRDDEEILAAHERDLDVTVAAQRPLQVARRRHATESASEHNNTHRVVLPVQRRVVSGGH